MQRRFKGDTPLLDPVVDMNIKDEAFKTIVKVHYKLNDIVCHYVSLYILCMYVCIHMS